MKRGTDGVSISRIGVAIAARRIKTTRMGGTVIVAGTQTAVLIKTTSPKVRFFHRALLNFEVFAAAFSCGVFRIFTYQTDEFALVSVAADIRA